MGQLTTVTEFGVVSSYNPPYPEIDDKLEQALRALSEPAPKVKLMHPAQVATTAPPELA